jgi:hypothetical protein
MKKLHVLAAAALACCSMQAHAAGSPLATALAPVTSLITAGSLGLMGAPAPLLDPLVNPVLALYSPSALALMGEQLPQVMNALDTSSVISPLLGAA